MSRMQRPVHVVGVGMIPFTKPGASEPYTVMGAKAAQLALADAGVAYGLVQQAYVGYVYGDSTAGQAAIYGVGLSGIPVRRAPRNGVPAKVIAARPPRRTASRLAMPGRALASWATKGMPSRQAATYAGADAYPPKPTTTSTW